MGAKRAVVGRSRLYDDLLLDWNRQHNPNFVEPVKRESKQERKERKEKEKAEKKRLQMEAAVVAGIDPNAKKSGGAGGTSTKKAKKAAAAGSTAAAGISTSTAAVKAGDEVNEVEDVDSETELDSLIASVRHAQDKGILGQPLAVTYDASSWFVMRRERVRSCRELFAQALMPSRVIPAPAGVPPRVQ